MAAGSAHFYLVEHSLPSITDADLAMLQSALIESCARRTARGEPVRYLGSAFLPRLHRLLSLFEAADPDTVRSVSAGALLPVTFVEVAITVSAGTVNNLDRGTGGRITPAAIRTVSNAVGPPGIRRRAEPAASACFQGLAGTDLGAPGTEEAAGCCRTRPRHRAC